MSFHQDSFHQGTMDCKGRLLSIAYELDLLSYKMQDTLLIPKTKFQVRHLTRVVKQINGIIKTIRDEADSL